jgi:hypothetical protein
LGSAFCRDFLNAYVHFFAESVTDIKGRIRKRWYRFEDIMMP